MNITHLTVSIALIASSLFANTDAVQEVNNSAKSVSGIETPSCVSCSSITSSTARIQKINKKTRDITFKNERGELSVFKVPAEVKNFTQLKVGDIVTTTITIDANIQVTKGAREAKSRIIKESLSKAKFGSKPDIKMKKVTVDQAKIIDLDYKTKSVTLESMHGILTITPHNVDHFRTLRVGDIVDAISIKTVEITIDTHTTI